MSAKINVEVDNSKLELTPCLNSYQDFLNWFLNRSDFTPFQEKEIEDLISDVKPMHYPCIPIINKNDLEAYQYISPEVMEHWYKSIRKQIQK